MAEYDGGVSEKDMSFDTEPTARGDQIAAYLRVWYEANRELWWDRTPFGYGGPDRIWADNLMLGLIGEVRRITAIADRIAPLDRRTI
jgi:hypothetical protein